MSQPEFDGGHARFRTALARRDPFAMAACYAADAVLAAAGCPPLAGHDAIEAYWWAGLEAGLRDVAMAPRLVERCGDLVVEVGTMRVALGALPPPGGPALPPGDPDIGQYVLVHRRQPDGRWAWVLQLLEARTTRPGTRMPSLPTG